MFFDGTAWTADDAIECAVVPATATEATKTTKTTKTTETDELPPVSAASSAPPATTNVATVATTSITIPRWVKLQGHKVQLELIRSELIRFIGLYVLTQYIKSCAQYMLASKCIVNK